MRERYHAFCFHAGLEPAALDSKSAGALLKAKGYAYNLRADSGTDSYCHVRWRTSREAEQLKDSNEPTQPKPFESSLDAFMRVHCVVTHLDDDAIGQLAFHAQYFRFCQVLGIEAPTIVTKGIMFEKFQIPLGACVSESPRTSVSREELVFFLLLLILFCNFGTNERSTSTLSLHPIVSSTPLALLVPPSLTNSSLPSPTAAVRQELVELVPSSPSTVLDLDIEPKLLAQQYSKQVEARWRAHDAIRVGVHFVLFSLFPLPLVLLALMAESYSSFTANTQSCTVKEVVEGFAWRGAPCILEMRPWNFFIARSIFER